MQRRGYNAFSYHHLSKDLGIKNAAIHYHFPSKEDLGVSIIERTRDRFKKWTSNPENRVLPIKEQLTWLIKSYEYNLNTENRICLIGALSTDYYTVPASMQKAIRGLSHDVQYWVAKLLESGRQTAEVRFDGRSQDKAQVIISSLTGSLQVSRLLGNDYFYQVVKQIHLDLNLTY